MLRDSLRYHCARKRLSHIRHAGRLRPLAVRPLLVRQWRLQPLRRPQG